jgi:hypothetical protein
VTEAQQGAAIRAVVNLADQVHWVREWPKKPTRRDRIHRWIHPETYLFDQDAAPPAPLG